MKKVLMMCCMASVILSSCTKQLENLGIKTSTTVNEFVKYTIGQGQQYSDKNGLAKVEYEEMKFIARFDSSAIYTTTATANQKDVNKLFGFSDNNSAHHSYSARFGWRWSNNALRLFSYVYNNGVLSLVEMGTVQIGADIHCSIKVSNGEYVFTMNEKVVKMPRASTTAKGVGYKLYPYFGGDEMAPHTITIFIKELL